MCLLIVFSYKLCGWPPLTQFGWWRHHTQSKTSPLFPPLKERKGKERKKKEREKEGKGTFGFHIILLIETIATTTQL